MNILKVIEIEIHDLICVNDLYLGKATLDIESRLVV